MSGKWQKGMAAVSFTGGWQDHTKSETSTRIQLQTSRSLYSPTTKFPKDHCMMKCTFEVDSSSNHLTLVFITSQSVYRKTKLFPSTKASALDGSNNIYSENSFIPILSSAAMNPWWLWRPRTGTSRLLPVMLTSPGLRQIFTRCTLLNQTKFTLVYLEIRASSPLVDSRAKSLFVLIFSSAERVKVLPLRARLMWNNANFTASWNLNMRRF